ncbi:MAG TPA: response regulator [Rhodanobacteraceae bacterium]|nr:response regulator [Rhodanobacteraceae bacterium]
MPVFDIFKRLVGTGTGSERRASGRLRASLGARVLVVDDSATIRAVLGKMLAQDGYEVLKAADGEGAVEMAQSQFPDLIFLDIVLPGISGFAVLRALRRDSRIHATPIIMMSGNQQATEQFYVQRFGADGFVKKPFGRADVFHAIRSLVQAGRMPARAEPVPLDVIPEGMTREEWNAIPDVGLPDEVQPAPTTESPPSADSPTPEDPAASRSSAPSGEAPQSNRPVTFTVAVAPMQPDATTSTEPVRGWSGPVAGMPVHASISGRVQHPADRASPQVAVHVRPAAPAASPPSAADDEHAPLSPDKTGD